MSHDDHGHGDSHKKDDHGSGGVTFQIDPFFSGIRKWMTDTTANLFVFGLFVIIGIGALYGAYLAPYLFYHYGFVPLWAWTAGPFLVGVIALENRDAAFLLLIAVIALVIIL